MNHKLQSYGLNCSARNDSPTINPAVTPAQKPFVLCNFIFVSFNKFAAYQFLPGD